MALPKTLARSAEVLSNGQLKLLAEARAALCAFLKLHLLDLPDEVFVNQIRRPSTLAFLQRLAQEPSLPVGIAQGAGLMLAFLETHAQTEAAQLAQQLGIDRTRLFRGISPDYGPPPPYETVWTASREMPLKRLQRISALYLQDGLERSPDSPERVDYLGVELAYLEALAQREAASRASRHAGRAARWHDRQRRFLAEHLGSWVAAYARKASEAARTDFYRGYLLMLVGFVEEQREILAN